jgi:beta-N-acetylhexosaminidase
VRIGVGAGERLVRVASAAVMKQLVIGFRGLEVTGEVARLLDEVKPGGVILFARNVESAEQVRTLTKALHARGIMVGIDQEGGKVNRLRNIVGDIPRDGRAIGECLRDLGIDLNFAPVLDLESDSDNALRERCWGRTPAEVIAGAGKFLDDLQFTGVTGCLKHFPGLGGATLDSHDDLPVISRDLTEDLKPFAALLPRARAVMVGHGVYPLLDPKMPASLSRRIVTGLLREELGFRGEVLTDDLEMGAIAAAMPFAEAVRAAAQAGADRLLVCHNEDRIMAAYETLRSL